MTIKKLISEINNTENELVILIINLPEIDKDFRVPGVVPLTDNWQFIATTVDVVNKINPATDRKSGWFDLLKKYIPEDQWELDIDTCNHPVTWYPSLPFDCWFEIDKTIYKQATEKALEVIKGLDPDKVPECYLHLI